VEGHGSPGIAVVGALENGLPHAHVNRAGTGEEFTFVGETMAASVDGDVLVETSAAAEEALELELPARSSVRPDYLSQLRPPLAVSHEKLNAES
jgi:predicted amidohydrolase